MSLKRKQNGLSSEKKGQKIGLLQAGITEAAVAPQCNTSEAAVSRLKRKYYETGSTDRLAGSGRPRKTTARQGRAIVREARIHHEITGGEVKENLSLNDVSERTVRRRIRECSDLKSYWKTKKPFTREKTRKLRVRWAKDHVEWAEEQWGKVLFSDESPFVLRFNKRGRVWRTQARQKDQRVGRFCCEWGGDTSPD
jgi:transposase